MTTPAQETASAEALNAETNWMYAHLQLRAYLPRVSIAFLIALLACIIWAATWSGPLEYKRTAFLTLLGVAMFTSFTTTLWMAYQVQRSKSVLVLFWRKPIWAFCLLNSFFMPFMGTLTPLMELYTSLCLPLLVVMVILTAYQNHRSPDLFDWHKMIQEERLKAAQEEQVNDGH